MLARLSPHRGWLAWRLAGVWLAALTACKSDPPAPMAAPPPAPQPSVATRPTPVVTPPAPRASPVDAPALVPALGSAPDPIAQGRVTDDADRRTRVEELRTRLDLDHDGVLSVDELRRSAYTRLDPATVDANHDGAISLDELEAALSPRRR